MKNAGVVFSLLRNSGSGVNYRGMEALNFLKSLLASDAGSFGASVVVFGFVIWAAWKISAALARIKEERKGVVKSISKVEERVEGIEEDMVYLKSGMKMLLSKAGMADFFKAHSPISLTQKGEATAARIDAPARVDSNWVTIRGELDKGLASRNAYDIQQFCFEKVPVAPERFFSAGDLDAMKILAYRNGDDFFVYCQILGVVIRDRYLKEKGIAVEEIDRTAPGNKQAGLA